MDSKTPRFRRLWRRVAITTALLVLPCVAFAAAETVTIKGKLANTNKLLNPAWNEAKDPSNHRYSFREFSPTVRSDARQLTGFLPKELCIAALSEKGGTEKAPLRVVIAGGRTAPVTLVVAPGRPIQFENHDPFPHRIYDVGNKGLQATDTAAAGQRSWTPPGPGKYEIRDQTTPSLRSWIVVEPKTVAVNYPDKKGEFALEVPPGVYKLRGYYNGEPVGQELDVTVGRAPAEQPLKNPLSVGDAPPAAAADAGTGG
jgi:hypothetical protein